MFVQQNKYIINKLKIIQNKYKYFFIFSLVLALIQVEHFY